jgi:hypothetical protein
MTARSKAISAGAKYTFWSGLDTDNELVGSSTTAPANGNQTGAGMTRLEGVKNVPTRQGDPVLVSVTGDDETLGTFEFDNEDLPNGILNNAVFDEDFEAYCLGLTVQQLGNLSLVPSGAPKDADRPTMSMIIQGRAKVRDAGAVGNSLWQGVLIPSASIVPLGRDAYQERTAAGYDYSITMSKGDKLPWGATLSNALNGTEQAAFIPFTLPHPLHVWSWRGNASETVFNLPYTPAGTTLGTDVLVFVEGVQVLSGVTISATGKTLTFGGAPADGAYITCAYEMSV